MIVSWPKGSEVANTLWFAMHLMILGKVPFLGPTAEHTLTSLSQPALTITGFEGFGLNRTHETHSVCPCVWIVNLQSPKVFQSLIVRSLDPETI